MPHLPDSFRNVQQLNRQLIYELLDHREHPCFTLMMPTHQIPPEVENDPLQFKNLVKELENKIRINNLEKYLPLISSLHQVGTDRDFWTHLEQGLVVFINPSYLKVVKVQIPLPTLTVVSDSFHVKPLYRYYQERGTFQVLALGQDHVRFYEGNKFKLQELDLSGKVPKSMKEALGSELTDAHYNTASATGKGSRKRANQGTGHVVHGYMEKSQEKENDTTRFFRIIDERIHEQFSKPSGLPLILATLSEHQSRFREHSKNKSLLAEGITADISQLTAKEIKDKAWEIFGMHHQEQIKEILEQQSLAESQNKSHSLLEDVALDAIDGKIEILLVEEDRIIKGKILEDERRIEYMPSGVDDILDDLSAMVIEKSGRVILLPADQMPHQGGAVSINRHP